jgi:hypothetical protein
MTATTFALMVMVGTAPAYQRGTYPSFSACAVAARSAVETLQAIEGQAVTWQCIPQDQR